MTQAGSLISAWENYDRQDIAGATILPVSGKPAVGKVSPVYSICLQSEAVWCATGTESGCINLWSVRHREGELIHRIEAHKGAVSVLAVTGKETELISGSWDKSVKHWSLDSGKLIRDYPLAQSNITSASFSRNDAASKASTSSFADNNLLVSSYDGCLYIYDHRTVKPVHKFSASSSKAPPWCISVSGR